MGEIKLPDLTFPEVKVGVRETPWTLLPLLYKGGALIRVDEVAALISNGSLGEPLLERIELVKRIHEVLLGDLAGGGSKWSALGAIENIRRFFRWVDKNNSSTSLNNIDSTYRNWADFLMHRVKIVKNISEQSAYTQMAQLGKYLDRSLDRIKPILYTTHLRKPKTIRQVRGTQAEKQNLQQTFTFGANLLDICDGLNLEKFWGPLPIIINFRNGSILTEYSRVGKRTWPHPIISSPYSQRRQAEKKALSHSVHEADRTLRTRYPIANLRIEAELLIFIAQTGMNLAQAHLLRLDNYSYSSYSDGYQVRSYKSRRSGPVLFEFFGEYREIFERYITWRNSVFPKDSDSLLFPLIVKSRVRDRAPKFERIRYISRNEGWSFISPQKLRHTRVNWLLRRSRDVDQTAEMDQHAKATLLNIYEEPSLQVAMSEITVFWQHHDPAITPPAPGLCIGSGPEPVEDIPVKAPPPDCMTPAGCLWCKHQRDIDSLDHVWSICSYRYLKTLELAAYRPPISRIKIGSPHPAELAITRLTEKLQFFKKSSQIRQQWVEESLMRIEEGHYHPDWIGSLEMNGYDQYAEN